MKRILALSLSAALLLALLCACGDPGAENSDPAGGNTSGPASQVDLAAFYLTLADKYQVPETPEQTFPDELADNDEMWLDGPESREDRINELKEQRDQMREMGLGSYPGLSDIAAEQCLVYVSMMSFSASEVVLVQVKNASDVDAVKNILQARIDAQLNGAMLYPMVAEVWENSARIVSNGSYVMLIVSEDCDAIVNDFNALFG